jgi:hypothetical protein
MMIQITLLPKACQTLGSNTISLKFASPMNSGFGLTPSKSTTEYARAFPSGSRKKITIMIVTGHDQGDCPPSLGLALSHGPAHGWLRECHQAVGFW